MKQTFTFKHTKKLFPVLALLLLVATACSKKNNDVQITGTAYIEVINASQTDSPFDFYVGSTKQNTQPIAYTQNTAYFQVNTGQQSASIKVNATGSTLAGFNITPIVNTYYSIFYFGGYTSAYVDDLSTVADKARVRFINLNLGLTGNVDYGIKSASSPLATNLGPAVNSAYYAVAPGSAFSVYATGTTTSILDIPTTIVAGHVYTVYLSGATTAALQATVLLQK
ncbi:MAG TPA: DUF4397 domain-containing protein [Mucilaginibacter sp.]|jgi:hypothetical protein|nr:DUF4397 domain-containing protein [Mucilaginibacter sp.]